MDYSPALNDFHSYQNDQYASPMSFPPAATPKSVAPVEERQSHALPDRRMSTRRAAITSALQQGRTDSPFSVRSNHADSVAPSTPRAVDALRIQPSIQNIVSTVNLACKLDLKQIALTARNAEYNPKRFAAVIMRIRNPRTTLLIFQSGKVVCTGAKSVADSNRAARRCARIIQKLGFPARFLQFKIQNMVGSVDVNFRIRLAALEAIDPEHCRYEAEIFPGLVYRIENPKIVLLIFESGKMVLTGAKHIDQIHEAFKLIYPVLKTVRRAP